MKRVLIILSIVLSYIPAIPILLVTSTKNPLLVTTYMIAWVIYIPILLALIYYIEKRLKRNKGKTI